MKRTLISSLLLLFVLTSFTAHKFYISIYQIKFAPEKKMLQITTRIFVDDLNKALEKKQHLKSHIGESNETPEEVAAMNQYLFENFAIKVNGTPKPIIFLSKELENNVVVGYYKITNVTKVTSLEIKNTALMDLFSDQQNIIQTTINGEKKSLLLTNETTSGVLK